MLFWITQNTTPIMCHQEINSLRKNKNGGGNRE